MYSTPEDVRRIAHDLPASGSEVTRAKAELAELRYGLTKHDRSRAIGDARPEDTKADAERAFKSARQIDAVDLAQLLLLGKRTDHVQGTLDSFGQLFERYRTEWVPPDPFPTKSERQMVRRMVTYVNSALDRLDRWSHEGSPRRMVAMERFYVAAADAGRVVVVERA